MDLWIARTPEVYAGQVVSDGECVLYVQTCSGAPHTADWRRGDMARERWPEGLAIATFDADGTYGNHTDGRSHAAILIEVREDGLQVWDQWIGHPVAQRTIRFKAGEGPACDDGDQYSPIRTVEFTGV